jgi:hypothetical protein
LVFDIFIKLGFSGRVSEEELPAEEGFNKFGDFVGGDLGKVENILGLLVV